MRLLDVNCASARSCVLAFLVFLIGSIDQIRAESDPTTESVVITATRTSQPIDATLSSVTVLTHDEIVARQVLSLQDLLQGEAGVQINNNGGLGKVSSAYLRGTEAEQVLVLIDGVRVGSATLGTTAFQYLPIDAIDHIEIVRGPRSSLYGSEAIGGVIQIFTRRAQDGFHSDATAAAGTHDTQSLGANLSNGSDHTTLSLSANNLTTAGYPNCRGIPYPPGGGCYVYAPTPDGFHNLSGSARLGYAFSDTTEVEGSILRAQGGTRYAGLMANHEDFVQQAATLSGHWSPSRTLRLSALVGQSRDDAQDSLNLIVTAGNRFDTARDNGSLQVDWQLHPRHLLTFGADYLRDRVSSDTPFPVTSRRVTGVFAEYQGSIGSEQWSLSARHDDNQQFGGATTGSVAWGYHFPRALTLTASYGSAFRAPSFDDLYFPGFGNPSLRPETSRSAEVGIDQRGAAGLWSVHAFDTRVHDLISFDANFIPQNTDEAHIQGVEVQGAVRTGPWTAAFTATWLDARNRTPASPNFDHLLPGRARETARLELGWQLARWRLSTRLNAAGPRFDDLANTAPLGGYTTLDALIEWAPSREWAVQAKLANLADRHYELALYYPQDGRNYLLTVRYSPFIP